MTPEQPQENPENAATPEQQEASPLTPEIMQRVDAYVQATKVWAALEKGENATVLNPKLQENVVEALEFIKEKIAEGKSDRTYSKKEQKIQFEKVDDFITRHQKKSS